MIDVQGTTAWVYEPRPPRGSTTTAATSCSWRRATGCRSASRPSTAPGTMPPGEAASLGSSPPPRARAARAPPGRRRARRRVDRRGDRVGRRLSGVGDGQLNGGGGGLTSELPRLRADLLPAQTPSSVMTTATPRSSTARRADDPVSELRPRAGGEAGQLHARPATPAHRATPADGLPARSHEASPPTHLSLVEVAAQRRRAGGAAHRRCRPRARGRCAALAAPSARS